MKICQSFKKKKNEETHINAVMRKTELSKPFLKHAKNKVTKSWKERSGRTKYRQ
jgi:hypothetical protein